VGSPPGRGRPVASIGESGPAIPSELVEALREARSVAVLTGSGISAESGVPTFREAQTGLWELYDPQRLATPEAFARDPKLVWEWYEWRRELVEKAHPNPGHRALAQLEALVPDFTLITQNVDGLHARAGSQNVIELHGNILRTKCSVEGMSVEEYENDASPPLCPNCGAPLRPDVVWFGEMLPHEAMEAASAAARGCDLFLSIGTSSLVYPAAGLPREALAHGAAVAEINLDETPLSADVRHALRGKAGDLLPAFVDALK
jgi:NAD-dependent deacetylase